MRHARRLHPRETLLPPPALRRLCGALTLLSVAVSRGFAQTPDSTATTKTPPAPEVDSLFHGRGFDNTGGIHVGVPAIVSISNGAKWWLGRRAPGAVFADVEPGVLDIRYGAGYQVTDQRLYYIGSEFRVGWLSSWAAALGAKRGVAYRGADVLVSWILLSGRIGAYVGNWRGKSVTLATFEGGLGF